MRGGVERGLGFFRADYAATERVHRPHLTGTKPGQPETGVGFVWSRVVFLF